MFKVGTVSNGYAIRTNAVGEGKVPVGFYVFIELNGTGVVTRNFMLFSSIPKHTTNIGQY